MLTRLARIWSAWKRFGEHMAAVFAMVFFGLLYVVVFAPVALVWKIRGRHFLPRFRGDESTYFLPKEKSEPTLESLRRQS